MSHKDCTILVCSCDSYEDCWEPFFELFRKYWPDCPYDIVLNTESKAFRMDGLDIACHQFYKAGESVPYGERLLRHLEEIDTPTIMIMMDDFFIRRNVSTEKIQYCINELKKNPDIAVFSFDSVKDDMNRDDGKYNDFMLRPKNGEYKMNLQGGGMAKGCFCQFNKVA